MTYLAGPAEKTEQEESISHALMGLGVIPSTTEGFAALACRRWLYHTYPDRER